MRRRNVKRLRPQQFLHDGDAFFILASSAIDVGPNTRVISRGVGIVAAASAIVVVEGDKPGAAIRKLCARLRCCIAYAVAAGMRSAIAGPDPHPITLTEAGRRLAK